MNGKTKATGFYREDAARIVSEAARLPAVSAPLRETLAETASPVSATPRPVPEVLLDEPQRPPLTPDPPINQNARAHRPELADLDGFEEPPRWSVGRIAAWILLAPWYVAIAAAAIGLDVLFVKDLLGF